MCCPIGKDSWRHYGSTYESIYSAKTSFLSQSTKASRPNRVGNIYRHMCTGFQIIIFLLLDCALQPAKGWRSPSQWQKRNRLVVFILLQRCVSQELKSCMDTGMSQELEHCFNELELWCLCCSAQSVTSLISLEIANRGRKQEIVRKPHLFPSGLSGSSEMQVSWFGRCKITTISFASWGF